ncbi:MAG: colanic biosynthesis UDP-glucose lipid carrier transferase [Thalassobius sp.]|nr:colanic biosynthesis UDP-glucose lipid carrier transferase [Thalassovita sp.]
MFQGSSNYNLDGLEKAISAVIPKKVSHIESLKSGDFFLYLGENVGDFQVKILEYGKCLSIASIEEAEVWLISNSNKVDRNLPKAIFCDYRFPKEKIILLLNRISQNKKLKTIPFILCFQDSTIVEISQFQLVKGIDDIYCQKTNGLENLISRLEFITKFKQLKFLGKLSTTTSTKKQNYIILFLKRSLDIIIAFSIISLLSPIFLLIAIIIRVESKGPVFYVSKRVGKHYKVFNFYKFRTMVVDADKKVKDLMHLNQYDSSVFFKVKNDPRITKIGAFLRKTSLDELPQFFNVLLGEMSLVGNRPLPIYEASYLTRDEWAERFLAPAGITGLWQITKRGKNNMSINERVALDIEYASNISIWLDLIIMYKTLPAMLQNENV